MAVTPRRRRRINARVVMFGGVATGLLALAVWVIFKASVYDPNLLAACISKRDPDPLFPIPGIVIWAAVAFLSGGAAAWLRARFAGSPAPKVPLS